MKPLGVKIKERVKRGQGHHSFWFSKIGGFSFSH